MKPNRGSVLGLMAIVLYVAVTLATLRSPTANLVAIVVNASVLTLLAASFRARFAAARPSRDWWFAFALFGWAYLLMKRGPFAGDLLIDWITNPAINAVFAAFAPSKNVPYTNAVFEANSAYLTQATKVFHASATIVFAYFGACLFAAFARRDARRYADQAHSEPARSQLP